MTRTWTLLAVAALLAACKDGKTEVVTPPAVPATITGSIVGRITDRGTGAPIAGVTVSALTPSGPAVAMSDAEGNYVLGGLPAGATHQLRFSCLGYVPMTQDVPLAGLGGNITQDNPMATANMEMASSSAALEGTVRAGGVPAVGAVVLLDLRANGYDLVATTITDAVGHYRLDGLPALTGALLTNLVQPWDSDGDGVAEWVAASAPVALFSGIATVVDVALSPTPGAVAPSFHLVSSDLTTGVHAPDAPMHLVYDRPLDAVSTLADVYDQTTYRDVALAWQVTGDGTSLIVAPVGAAPLAAGHSYRMQVTAVALDGSMTTSYFYFSATSGGTPPGPVTGLTAQPAAADAETRTFTLRWNGVAGADRYEIWIRDTHANPMFTLLTTVGTAPAPAASVTLPTDFDWYSADGLSTPFLWRTAVDFAVVAVGVAGASGGVTSATPLRIVDAVPPTVISAAQDGSADATGGGARIVSLSLGFSEYLDPSSHATIALPTGSATATVAIDPGLRQATVSVSVPAGVDATGVVTISGLTDTSGNAMVPYARRLTRRILLTANGDFEAGSLAGWTTYVSGTASPPTWIATPAATGSGAVRIGADSTTPQSGYSRIYQDVVVPAGALSLVATVSTRGFTTAPSAYDDLECGLYTTGGSLISSLLDTYVTTTSTFATASRSGIAAAPGTTIRVQCQVYEWSSYASRGYVDDLALWAEQ